VVKIEPMAVLCRLSNALVNCRDNIDDGQHGEKPIQVDCGTAQLVACSPFESFAVGMSVMMLDAANAYNGETDALSHGIGENAREFHKALLS
jgi:hypothetical protein